LKTFFPILILFPHFLLKYYRIWVADSKSLTYTFVVAMVTKIGDPIGSNMAFAPKMIGVKVNYCTHHLPNSFNWYKIDLKKYLARGINLLYRWMKIWGCGVQ
jgi:hypothetical protein